MTARIKATVVGSYPVPSWLIGNTSRLVLRDAVMAVLKTQELAGLDLISDGELMRFDPSHPETNGMVDYFASRMDGIRKHFALSDFEHFRSDRASGYRLLTAGMVVGKIQDGALNLPRDYEFVHTLTKLPLKFTCTGPHMLARVLTNCFYKNVPDLAMDIAVVLRRQLELIEAATIQLDEACIAGYPEDASWAAEAINYVLDGLLNEKAVHICFGNYGGQPQLRGFWRDLIPFLNSLRTDHLVLEFARHGYDDLPLFNDLNPKIALSFRAKPKVLPPRRLHWNLRLRFAARQGSSTGSASLQRDRWVMARSGITCVQRCCRKELSLTATFKLSRSAAWEQSPRPPLTEATIWRSQSPAES